MKKFLSMVLALTMVLSLFTMTTAASAKDFTDDDSINYAEAIDVISALQVVDGYVDGSFKPEASLTRGAAAKIITNMILGPTASNALTTSAAPFKDVPANHTFAGQIAYCAQQGIINGYSDGTFKPGSTLTGYAFLKMLLGALGYDGSIEGFTGANWTINVAKLAKGVGMMNDVADDFSGTAALNRETACLFAFNTLSCDLVVYNQLLVGAGNTVTNHGDTASPKYWNSQSSYVNGTNIVNDNIVQFGEEYFSRLIRNQGYFNWWDNWDSSYNTDAMGRPASTWTYRGNAIGTYVKEADASYIGDVSLNQIYYDLGMSTGNNRADHGTTTIMVNGVPFASSISGDKISVSADGALSNVKRNTLDKVGDYTKGYDWWLERYYYNNRVAGSSGSASSTTTSTIKFVEDKDSPFNYTLTFVQEITNNVVDPNKYVDGSELPSGSYIYDNFKENKVGKGTIIEVYRNDKTNDVVIDVISVYGGKISALRNATAQRDAYVEIEYGSDIKHRPVSMNAERNWFATTGFEVDNVVAYTYSDKEKEINTMKTIESVEGSLTKRTVEKDMTLGEVTYKYSNEYNFEFGLSEKDLTYGSNYRVFLDDDGNALWIEEAAFNLMDYALIERISCETRDVARESVISHTIDDLIDNSLFDKYGEIWDDVEWTNGNQPKEPWNNKADGTTTGTTSTESVTNSIWDGNRARLLFADGTEKTVTLDKSYVIADGGSQTRYGIAKGNITGNAPTLEFWAGDIVRVSNLANGTVRLSKIDQYSLREADLRATGSKAFLRGSNVLTSEANQWFFGAYDGTKVGGTTPATQGFVTIKNREVTVDNGPTKINVNCDSQTVFVVKVTDGDGRTTYKVYTGIMNAPTIEEGVGFVFMKTNLAKIVYITDGVAKNVSKDVTFIALRSASGERTESDTNQYYTYNAVVRGEIVTIDIAHSAFMQDLVGINDNDPKGRDKFTPGRKPGAKSGAAMIANNYISDVDSLISNLTYDNRDIKVNYEWGIKAISDTEVRVGTINGYRGAEQRGMVLPVSKDVRVYAIDTDGGIESITMADVITSYDRVVYYTLDDGEVTNMFIVEVIDRDDAAR